MQSAKRKIALSLALTLVPLATIPALADIPFTTQTGTLTLVNDAVSFPSLQGESSCSIDVSGTWSGVITTEGTISSTWFSVFSSPIGSTTSSTTITANGQYAASCTGLRGFRARLSTATSGSAVVVINTAQGLNPVPLPVTAATPFPVTGTFFQATQPVSLATLPPLATGSNTIGSVNVLGGNATAVKVDGSAVTQPVSIATTVPVSTPAPYSFYQTPISGTGAYVVKASAGTYYGMTNISSSGMPQRTTCYDNASAASGTVVALTQLSQNSQLLDTPSGVAFANGLTCANSGNLTGNGIQILYR